MAEAAEPKTTYSREEVSNIVQGIQMKEQETTFMMMSIQRSIQAGDMPQYTNAGRRIFAMISPRPEPAPEPEAAPATGEDEQPQG